MNANNVPLLFFFGVVAGILISLAFLHYVPVFKSTKYSGPIAVFSNQNYSHSSSNHNNGSLKWSWTTSQQPLIKLPSNQPIFSVEDKKTTAAIASTTYFPSESSKGGMKAPKLARPRWTPGDAIVTRKDYVKTTTQSDSSTALSSAVQDMEILPKSLPSKAGRGKYKKKAGGGRSGKIRIKETIFIDKNRSAPMVILASQIPTVPYHNQAHLDFNHLKVHIPTYKNVKRVPDMRRQKGEFEKENLKLHLCNAVFEAYSASYLTTKHHMLSVASESYNLSWVNCEMASFIHMKESNRFYSHPESEGLVIQALDLLDFSVIHLSAYERSTHKYRDVLFKTTKEMKANWHNIDPVIEAGKRLDWLNNPFHSKPRVGKSPVSNNIPLGRKKKIEYSKEALRTVVVMPFLGGAMGAGHSKLGNRFEYLKTCFWSIYEFIPNIVAGVTRQEDVDWGMKESGLPFYELILITGLPKSAGLPVATTQHTKQRLLDGRWDFDYIFFTESDQILISRDLPIMYEHLKKYPGHMVLPHRLMPYSSRVMEEAHDRLVTGKDTNVFENQWMNQSCCMERQNCVERRNWLTVKDERVPIISYYGLFVPLGNINFLTETYRACSLSPYVGSYCP